ncbi:class I SAM-dependent methyltransferase [Clostridiaceae bacterium HSG29]|nr:class I SAM-dependent methyltransferase [Clostridiaceae bacterium HSG29]
MQKCKICGSECLKHLYNEKSNTNYYFCEVCEFVFQDDNEIVSLEKEKEIYDLHDNSFESKGYVDMFENFIDKAIKPFIQNKGNVLDFGSGPGPVLAKILENQGWNVKIFDPIYDDNDDYLNYKYDLITSTEVFEHFSNPLKELEKISKLLNKNGVLAIMTILRPKTMDEFKEWWYIRDVTHISFYSQKTLYLMGKIFGLKMVYNDNKRLITFKKL